MSIEKEPRKLNLGCGLDIRQGWVNVDSVNLPGVDIVCNIEKLPLPFPDEEFNEILCRDILEHTEYPPVLKDIHRILKRGGKLSIQVPHFTSKNNFVDPTHKKLFSVSTFDFFVEGTPIFEKHSYYFDFVYADILSSHITFERAPKVFFYNSLVEWIVNKSPRMQRFYESTGFSRIFPAENITVELTK